jgi:hypothetical protein
MRRLAAVAPLSALLLAIVARGGAQPAPAWTRGATCYEVFVRSFADSDGDGVGDIPGLIARLDYINDGDPRSTRSLGARCIWLMPIMSDCITNPDVRCDSSSLSATNARNGSIEMLIDASRTQSSVAAIHRLLDVGITKSAIEARMAPVRK